LRVAVNFNNDSLAVFKCKSPVGMIGELEGRGKLGVGTMHDGMYQLLSLEGCRFYSGESRASGSRLFEATSGLFAGVEMAQANEAGNDTGFDGCDSAARAAS
jgi:hypothetical protein